MGDEALAATDAIPIHTDGRHTTVERMHPGKAPLHVLEHLLKPFAIITLCQYWFLQLYKWVAGGGLHVTLHGLLWRCRLQYCASDADAGGGGCLKYCQTVTDVCDYLLSEICLSQHSTVQSCCASPKKKRPTRLCDLSRKILTFMWTFKRAKQCLACGAPIFSSAAL